MQNTACMLVFKTKKKKTTLHSNGDYSFGTQPTLRLQVRKAEFILQFVYEPLLVPGVNKKNSKKPACQLAQRNWQR